MCLRVGCGHVEWKRVEEKRWLTSVARRPVSHADLCSTHADLCRTQTSTDACCWLLVLVSLAPMLLQLLMMLLLMLLLLTLLMLLLMLLLLLLTVWCC